MNHRHSRQLKVWFTALQGLGLVAIASLTFSIISTILFGLLGLAPSHPDWHLVPLSGGVLALAGIAVGIQTLKPSKTYLMGIVSGLASGAILGFYHAGQLSQEISWAVGGAILGGLLGGALAEWAYRPQPGLGQYFFGVAIAIVSTLCAYGTAFGFGAWTLMAVSTQHWGLAFLLTLPTGLYLWLTQRSLRWIYRQCRKGWEQS
ncbi:hypothetical protein C1752_01642 [Acaryochloris thomasi RCC1774]|uniref:DUF4203 domain-containing protein n=1 Tax=Acaryochloris thomasi RCC1774 TaxID=1764569 RepID=A0A2W1JTM9_9CYAN|nr:hypothetical protein [Acaryochloris thomasi]PZD73922.1 hypothetical protein C1752_01642 [Acaryochloris thomasi RCC1774]